MDEIVATIGEAEALLYTKDNCPKCDSTKSLMDQLEVNYTVVNMDSNPAARTLVKSLGFRQAPVVVTRDGNWSGYQEEKIMKLKPAKAQALEDDVWA